MKTLIKNATVVAEQETLQTNVLIAGSKIVAIDPALHTDADETIDARGLVLMPGVIDDQVHFRQPGLTHKEDLEHATRACAKGGVTSFLEMPNTVPTTTSQQRLNEKLDLASQLCRVNYGFYIGATPTNLQELKCAKRTPGIKIFIGSSTGDLLVDEQTVLEQIFAETTLPICAHCEDESTVRANADRYADSTDVATHSLVRDHRAAVIATQRAIDLATRFNHPFHVLHVSTADEIPIVLAARGIVTAEVCHHHLFFNTDDYARLGSLIKMNPSVKSQADNQALWRALIEGNLQVIATDHAPHTLVEKSQPYPQCPSGLPAVENSLALILNEVVAGRCTLEQVVQWMCTAPAMVWNIVGKGIIAEGYDADLVLVDLDRTITVLNSNQQTKCGWSPWHGTELTGWPVRTWVMGQSVFILNEDNVPWFLDQPIGTEIQFDPGRGGYWKQ
ncbi:MAG TPA: dihydroorotase [Pirellulaceae bacterium]|nr:dihydroorotase [Pirellulaceae bacterium]HMO92977.1 dihydroorotase [Pirellulaceae bacterium]HMP67944.1 dihydroorotase [Pirellulaceae bacterium]